jgi:hypothetical protein
VCRLNHIDEVVTVPKDLSWSGFTVITNRGEGAPHGVVPAVAGAGEEGKHSVREIEKGGPMGPPVSSVGYFPHSRRDVKLGPPILAENSIPGKIKCYPLRDCAKITSDF